MAILLNEADVRQLLPMEAAIEVVEAAFRELARGNVVMPPRTVLPLRQQGGLQLGMPAYIGGEIEALGLKVVTVFGNNPSTYGLPAALGVMLMNNIHTGEVEAVLDAAYLTAVRTGAVGGVAAKYLAPPDAACAGVFGAGVQARTQLWALACVRNLATAKVFDLNPDKAESFAAEMTERLDFPVDAVPRAREVLNGADVIIAATSAAEPIFNGAWLEAGQHITAVGSHAPEARELDTQTILRSKVVTDQREACLAEAGDLLLPIQEGVITETHIYADLGEVATGMKPARESAQEITLFKSVGLAIQDVAAAKYVVAEASNRGLGRQFDF